MTSSQYAALSVQTLRENAAAIFQTGPYVSRKVQILRPLICPFGPIIDAAKLLDVGCGAGLFIGLITTYRSDIHATGFDVSKAAINLAKQMQAAHSAKNRIAFNHQSVASAWPESNFDAVTLIDILHHLSHSEQQTAFETAVAHLKSDGRLIIKDMARRPRWRAFANWIHDIILARQSVRLPREEDLMKWAKASGLILLSKSHFNMLWYGHVMWVFARRS